MAATTLPLPNALWNLGGRLAGSASFLRRPTDQEPITMTRDETRAARKDRNARIVAALQAGTPLEEVARAHGVTVPAIDAVARHAGAPYPTPREYALLTALRMLLEGKTEAAITRKLKTPTGYVAEVRSKARAVGFKV